MRLTTYITYTFYSVHCTLTHAEAHIHTHHVEINNVSRSNIWKHYTYLCTLWQYLPITCRMKFSALQQSICRYYKPYCVYDVRVGYKVKRTLNT